MYIMAIGWGYVALMMALAEATNANGSILGAMLTFVCYGLMPVGLLLYVLGRPARRRRREQQAASVQPDAGGHAPGAAEPGSVAPVRKEP
jgi:hypothetical protein